MIPISLKAAFRQLWKNKLFTTVNVIGLSVGLASVMALLIGVYMYITADGMQRDKERMFYLRTTTTEGRQFSVTAYPLLDEILKTCPEAEAGTHLQDWSDPWLKYGEKEAQESTQYVDTGFFRVFSFPFKFGNPATALRDKYSAVISDKVALQLFGKENPVGKIITSDDTVQLTVTGVLETIPVNSTVRADVLLTSALLKDYPGFSSNANWYNAFSSNFLKLRPGSDTGAFNLKLAKLVALNYSPERKGDKISAAPFASLRNEAGPVVSTIIKGSIGTAFFILLIILVNLLNLNTAAMTTRGKEVAVRQMTGSGKMKIVKQFCLENGIIVFSSVIVAALLFSNLLLPELNDMYGSRFGIIIACVIAFPLALYAMHSWLQSFAYRIDIQWWMFAIAGGIAILIAFGTVGFQAIQAAVANPVTSFRSE